MLTVGLDPAAVETALCGGELSCPRADCGQRLAPWGWARARRVRGDAEVLCLRPRRSICSHCRYTQVLLPASVLLRRADVATVIGAALLAKTEGLGHRRIAVGMDRPASTVRGWLRRAQRVADQVLGVLAALAAELGAEFMPPAATTTSIAAMVEMVGALSAAVARRLGGSCPPWRLAALATGGCLLAPGGPRLPTPPPGRLGEPSNTNWLWAGPS